MIHYKVKERHNYFGRLKRILLREMNIQEEYSAFIYGASRTKNGGTPVVQVVTLGSSRTVRRWVTTYLSKFFLNAKTKT